MGDGFDLEKMRSIGAPRKRQAMKRTVEQVVEGDRSATLITTEHRDGRRDVTVRPATDRYEAQTHKTGRKRGQVAEIRPKGATA